MQELLQALQQAMIPICISGLANVCVGAIITLTDGVTGGIWSSSNTNAIVYAGVVTGVAAGNDSDLYIRSGKCVRWCNNYFNRWRNRRYMEQQQYQCYSLCRSCYRRCSRQ